MLGGLCFTDEPDFIEVDNFMRLQDLKKTYPVGDIAAFPGGANVVSAPRMLYDKRRTVQFGGDKFMRILLLSAACAALFFSGCDTKPQAGNQAVNQSPPNNSAAAVEPFGNGLKTIKSSNDFDATYAKLKAAIEKNEALKIVAEINHEENAGKAGLNLRPTRLIIFGNPKLGTPLMNESQTLAIDLPQKMLVYKNEKEEVFVAFNDPLYLAKRHGVNENREEFGKIAAALNALAQAATSNE